MSVPKIRLKHQRLSDRLKSKKKKAKRRLVCHSCEEKFTSWWEIWDHWKSTGHKQPESCRWCSKKTFTLQSHLCKQHWPLATMCRFCGQLFMFVEDNERHQLSHDGTTYRCYHCGRRRLSESLLHEHVITHYQEDRYGCSVCEKRFKKKKNMESHLKMVHCICQYCGIQTDNYNDLKKHAKDHRDLLCVHCNKTFTQKNRLKYHFQIKHSHQDMYKCAKCFQRFPTKSRLLDHVALVHKGKCNFRCEFCQKPFLYKQQYVNHVNQNHTQSMPSDSFICRHCGFSTDRKIKLRWHVERTSGVGFQCTMCQVKLECKGLYDKHMETHAEGRLLFLCDICHSNYSSDATLRHHISLMHPEVMMCQNPRGFPCTEPGCMKYYMTKASLARHMRRVHTQIETPKPETVPEAGTAREKSGKRNQKQKGGSKTKTLLARTRLGKENKPYGSLKQKKKLEAVSVYYCNICQKTWFRGVRKFQMHIASHGKKVWHDQCEMCNLILETPEEAVRHYVEDHFNAEFKSLDS